MPKFCSHCGAAAGAGRFCGVCGKPLEASPNAPPPVPIAPPLPPKQGSGLKIVLITLALLAVLAIAGTVTAVYYIKHRVHDGLARLKERTGVDLPSVIDASPAETGPKRNGCLLLSKDEAQDIVGFSLVRADGTLTASQEEHCDYYADPHAAQLARDQARARLEALRNGGAADMAKVEELVKGISAGTNDGVTPILQITVYRGNGKMATSAFNAGSALLGVKPEPIPGPWDEAVFGPMNSTLTLRKGNNGVMIDLRQIPKGHDKGLELAKLIAPRL